MKTQIKSRKQTIINFLLLVFQAGLFLSGATLIFYIIFGAFELLIGGSNFMKDFPVVFSFNENGVILFPEQPSVGKFDMDHAIGKITVENLPKHFIASFGLLRLIQLICVFISMNLTVNILKAAKRGDFFIKENALRLRKIGLLGIILYLLEFSATIFSSHYFSDKLQFSGLEFEAINRYTFFDAQTIFFSLFLLVISEAFRIGAELQEDVDLSI